MALFCLIMYVFISFIKSFSSQSVFSLWEESPTHVISQNVHTVPTRTGLLSDVTGCSVFSGSLAFRVVHVLAYHSELRGGLSIKFRGLKTVPIPTHVSLLLEKLCSWHLNHGVQKLISDVFLNRIMSQNPSFSSCKHMSHLTPLKPYQIQSAREQRITYSRP